MEKSTKSPNVEIEYCASWGGSNEAYYVRNVIKEVYPSAKFRVYSPGYTKNLVVISNGEKVYDRNGQGGLNEKKMVQLINDIGISAWSSNKTMAIDWKIQWRCWVKLWSQY